MKTAILLAAHGAKESVNADAATSNLQKVYEMTGLDTYKGYVHIEPFVQESISRMSAEGVDRAVIVPLFTFSGFIPDIVLRKSVGAEPGSRTATIEAQGRDMEVIFTETLCDHPLMKDILLKKCEKEQATAEHTSIMLIWHGSRKAGPDDNAEMCADYLRNAGYDVICSYNEFQHPTVEEGLSKASSSKSDVLAIPMFISPGSHTISDIPPKLMLKDNCRRSVVNIHGKDVTVRYADEIGMESGITDIIMDRIRNVMDVS
ncbi:MAG: hypothetical protein E7Z64_05660 [Thermoplasmata archaeon]|nr:hypothetical protein [Thermoplasmata archaeon]